MNLFSMILRGLDIGVEQATMMIIVGESGKMKSR